MKEQIDNVLVLKIGTSTLTERAVDGSERLDEASFECLGKQVLELQENGHNVVIVSSAAITAGMIKAGVSSRGSETAELQRLASIGWRHILNAWDSALEYKTIGELLLTRRELGVDSERQEALQLTHSLLGHGDIAIANENDAISHEEIAFGDNDTLAATYAACISRSSLFGANVRLVLLSDVYGVYAEVGDANSVIATISDLSQYEHLAQDTNSQNGTGGMITKFAAAKIACSSNVATWVTNGRTENAIRRTLNGEIGTHFCL